MDPQKGQDSNLAQQPVTQPEVSTSASEAGTEIIAPDASFTWQASEYVFHEKPTGWYLALWGFVAVVALILGLLKQWLSIAVVAMMGLAVVMYSRKEPRTLTYSLDNNGVSINGKISSFHMFRSYSVHQEVGWVEIDWEPARRFAPRLTILCEKEDFDKIEAIITHHLPRVDRDHDWMEQLARYLKF